MRDLQRHLLKLNFTVVGDSLAYGTGASSPERSFTSLIYRALARSVTPCEYLNLAVPGATINDVLVWQTGRIPATSDVIVLVVGSNDVPSTSDPHTFAQEYGRLLGRIRAAAPGAQLFVAGVPNIAVTPHVPTDAKPLVASLCAILSTEIAMQAATHQAEFIDLFAITERAGDHAGKYLAEDSFHPSDRGYALISRATIDLFARTLGVNGNPRW